MATLENAKAEVLKQFQEAISPDLPKPVQFTTVDRINRPIFLQDVLTNSVHRVIRGTFVPATANTPPGWSNSYLFATSYLNMVENMAYGVSTKDQNHINDLLRDNQDALNNLVRTYEQLYGRITEEQMAAAGVKTKVDYFVAQVPILKKTLYWSRFATDYKSVSADLPLMENINSAKVNFANQITAIKQGIMSPSLANSGSRVFSQNGAKVWAPGYYVDKNFSSRFQNGKTIPVSVHIQDVGTASSSLAINGVAGGAWKKGYFAVCGKEGAQCEQTGFLSLMSNALIDLEYRNVSYLAVNPTALSTDNTRGWYLPDILDQALKNTSADTGPFFVTAAEAHKATLRNGELQALQGFLVSAAPTGTMQFGADDYASVQQYFHTATQADVSLFGFLPLATANTSYTKSAVATRSSEFSMEVKLNSSGDHNNLVIHGAVLENPIQGQGSR